MREDRPWKRQNEPRRRGSRERVQRRAEASRGAPSTQAKVHRTCYKESAGQLRKVQGLGASASGKHFPTTDGRESQTERIPRTTKEEEIFTEPKGESINTERRKDGSRRNSIIQKMKKVSVQ